MAVTPKSCLKYGCVGCLGIFGLVLIVGGGIAGIAAVQGPLEEHVESRELSQEIPRMALGEATGDVLRTPDLGSMDVPPAVTGRVILDVHISEFRVKAGPPDQPIRVEARYDTELFELEQEFKERGKDQWVYKLAFGHRGMVRLLRGDESQHPEVTLIIPAGTPISLEGSVTMGESRIDLSDLWVVDLDLQLGKGDHEVRITSPQPQPMRGFKVKSSMGEVDLVGLGYASPESVNVSHSMGQMTLDLRGDWMQDSKIRARCSMGECRIRVPEEVALDLSRPRAFLAEGFVSRRVRERADPPPGAPSLSVVSSQTMGSIRIE